MDQIDKVIMSRIKISIQEAIDIEVESDELPFSELKKEALDIFNFAKENMLKSKPDNCDVT